MPVSALQNPNHTINALARALVKGKIGSPQEAVALWLENKDKAAKQRHPIFQKAGKAALLGGMASEQTKAQKAASQKKLAKAKRAVAKEFAKLPGYGKSRGKKGRKVSYQTRALRPKAAKYLKRTKTIEKTLKSGRVIRVPNISVIREYNTYRQQGRSVAASREQGKFANRKYHDPIPSPVATWKTKGPYKVSGAYLQNLKGGPSAMMEAMAVGLPGRANPYYIRRSALQNGLALTNPSIVGFGNFFLGYALPVTIAGGVAGAAHAALSGVGVTSTISDLLSKVPGGEKVAEFAPFTVQGLLVGSVASLALGALGLASGQGMSAGKAAALVTSSLFVTGAGLDLFYFVTGMQESAGDEADDEAISSEIDAELSKAEQTLSGLGGLALENPFLGDLAFDKSQTLGDGMAFEVASLTATQNCGDYDQATLADAFYSGIDLSMDEGQALMNGRDSWFSRFGAPSFRMGRREVLGASHFAGKPGHRWAWLIKLLGWQKAAALAAMPPAMRVATIKKMRKAAIEAYNQAVADQQAASAGPLAEPELAPAAGTVAVGPEGSVGATNYLGDPALFTGV